MWPRPKASADEVILSKLVQLARGDVALVNQAIRAARQNGDDINLSVVVDYIARRAPQSSVRTREPA